MKSQNRQSSNSQLASLLSTKGQTLSKSWIRSGEYLAMRSQSNEATTHSKSEEIGFSLTQESFLQCNYRKSHRKQLNTVCQYFFCEERVWTVSDDAAQTYNTRKVLQPQPHKAMSRATHHAPKKQAKLWWLPFWPPEGRRRTQNWKGRRAPSSGKNRRLMSCPSSSKHPPAGWRLEGIIWLLSATINQKN